MIFSIENYYADCIVLNSVEGTWAQYFMAGYNFMVQAQRQT